MKDVEVLPYLPFAMIICNTAGIVTHFNEKADDICEHPLTKGMRFTDIWNGCEWLEEDHSAVSKEEFDPQLFIQNGASPKQLNLYLFRKDKSKLKLKIDMARMGNESGNVVGILYCMNIVEREEQQREEAEPPVSNEKRTDELKRSEDRFKKVVEEVEDYAIVLLDKHGMIQNWNRGAEKIKGYKDYEIVGKSFSNFYRHADREKGLPETLLNQAAKTGKAIHEGWRLRKDGTVFWGSIVITALHNNKNEITGFLKVTRDLTERKIAEDQAKEYNLQLEFQNKELQQFAFAASHDMKEPLRKINFYNNYVITNEANILDERSKEYMNRSMAAVKRMGDLIDDLLSYSQIDSAVKSFVDTDLNEIIDEIIASHKDIVEEKQVQFITAKLPQLHVIPFQVRQLFDNLINNSIKYKHPDRKAMINITCEVITGEAVTVLNFDASTDYYKISVIDNGLGFQPFYAEKIFEIFQRLKSKSAYKGSGIGLAMCKKIVQNHRGYILATGKENEGARFDVYFPTS